MASKPPACSRVVAASTFFNLFDIGGVGCFAFYFLQQQTSYTKWCAEDRFVKLHLFEQLIPGKEEVKGKAPTWTNIQFIFCLFFESNTKSTPILHFFNRSLNKCMSLKCICFCPKYQWQVGLKYEATQMDGHHYESQKTNEIVHWWCVMILSMQTWGRVVWTSLAAERAPLSVSPFSGNVTERRTVTTERTRSTVVGGHEQIDMGGMFAHISASAFRLISYSAQHGRINF